MVSKTSCVTAGVLHLIGASFFLPQPQNQCSAAPKLGRFLFLLATLLFLGNSKVIPRRYMQMAPGIISFVELLLAVFVQEWLMHVLWCSMERFIHRMARIFCQNCFWCEFGVDTLSTLLMGLSALYVVAEVVCPPKVKAAVERTIGRVLDRLPINRGSGSLVERIKDLRCYVRGAIFFFRLTRDQRMLIINVLEVQVELAKREILEAMQADQGHYQDIAAESEEAAAGMQKQGEDKESLESSLENKEPSSEITKLISNTQNQEKPLHIDSLKHPLEFLGEEEPPECLERQDEPPFQF
ncbi:uncharacterized protein LOC117587678 [Drosophila guanche]|uniref:Uncharacterized protein n=1 Tax=Drosophila guanche TaxID=7266 RepID=A0A3B0KHI3_DROGU|nr:uncharacterized protein LOC117587678 [Drosophila guanche]SPP85849.1 Hypothetical predicted protein [Drosophila guanche]